MKNKYEVYERIVAVLISLGMMLFLWGTQGDRGGSSGTTTTLSGRLSRDTHALFSCSGQGS